MSPAIRLPARWAPTRWLPPWRPRGVEVRGRAEVHGEGGEEIGPGFDADVVRIFPKRIVGWGLDSDAFRPNSRTVEMESA